MMRSSPGATVRGPKRAARRRRHVALVLLLFLSTMLAGCLDGAADKGKPATGATFAGPDRPGFTAGRAVVAVIDSGIDPYHQTFADADRTWAAKDVLPGYPQVAQRMVLTTDAADYTAALEADARLWDAVAPEVLYDVAGTRIIGMIGFGDGGQSPNAVRAAPGLDELGHGTAAAGMVQVACPECLIVAIEVPDAASGRTALDWVAKQSWIDIVAYPARSGGAFAGARYGELDSASSFVWARQNVEAGQVVVVSSGNGYGLAGVSTAYSPARDVSYSYWTAGPDWVVTVGAVNPANGEASTWHSSPVDLVAQGLACQAPHAFSLNETVTFEGTSCSAPVAAGWFGQVLAATRDHLRDGATGPRSDQRLVVPHDIEAPSVTREDLTRAVYRTAERTGTGDLPVTVDGDPEQWTTSDGVLAPTYAGWGTHTDQSLQRAVDVLVGAVDVPAAAPEQEQWFPVDQRIRIDVWGEYERGTSRIPYPAPLAGAVQAPGSAAGVEALYLATLGLPAPPPKPVPDGPMDELDLSGPQ